MRRTRPGVLIGLTLFWTLGALLSPPAWAHTTLVSSTPTDGAQLDTPPTTIELVFSEPVDPRLVTVVVSSPSGARWQVGAPVVTEAVVSQEVRPLPEVGEYAVAYRVVSADGHPVSGEMRFTLTEAAPMPTATSPPSVAAAATSTIDPRTATEDSSGIGAWTYAAIGLPVAAVLFVVGMGIVRTRARSRGGAPEHGR